MEWIELMIVIAIMGVLAAIAIPIFHQSYVTKTKISEGVLIAKTYQLAITEVFNSNGPNKMYACTDILSCDAMGITYFAGSQNIQKIESNASGVITVTFTSAVLPANANALELVPQVYSGGIFNDLDLSDIANTAMQFQWRCRPASANPIAVQLLPRECKP